MRFIMERFTQFHIQIEFLPSLLFKSTQKSSITSIEDFCVDLSYTIPCAIIAFATFSKAAIFAPAR